MASFSLPSSLLLSQEDSKPRPLPAQLVMLTEEWTILVGMMLLTHGFRNLIGRTQCSLLMEPGTTRGVHLAGEAALGQASSLLSLTGFSFQLLKTCLVGDVSIPPV